MAIAQWCWGHYSKANLGTPAEAYRASLPKDYSSQNALPVVPNRAAPLLKLNVVRYFLFFFCVQTSLLIEVVNHNAIEVTKCSIPPRLVAFAVLWWYCE